MTRRPTYSALIFFFLVLSVTIIGCTGVADATDEDEKGDKNNDERSSMIDEVIKPWGQYRLTAQFGNVEAYVSKIYDDGWIVIQTRKKPLRRYVNLDNVLMLQPLNPPPSSMPTSLKTKLRKAEKYAKADEREKIASILAPEVARKQMLTWLKNLSRKEILQLGDQLSYASTFGVDYRSDEHKHLRLYDPLELLDYFDEDIDSFSKYKGEWYPRT